MIRPAILCLGLSLLSTGGASAGVSGGQFVSLDGSMSHSFAVSGDYTGKSNLLDAPVTGVYREEPGVCWITRDDGSKKLGDLIFYVGEVQCCLSTETIADKTVMTVIWETGTGGGYAMCKNQVFRPVRDLLSN